MTTPLWETGSVRAWRLALGSYDEVIAAQGVASLRDHDEWYRNELPAIIAGRRGTSVTLPELVRVTRWKMSRGKWRARNLVLVQDNEPALVLETSRNAFRELDHSTRPISTLSTLAGVGPATASAVVAAVAPARFPFFEDLVAEQVPGLGKVAYTHWATTRATRRRSVSARPGWVVTGTRRSWSAPSGHTPGARWRPAAAPDAPPASSRGTAATTHAALAAAGSAAAQLEAVLISTFIARQRPWL